MIDTRLPVMVMGRPHIMASDCSSIHRVTINTVPAAPPTMAVPLGIEASFSQSNGLGLSHHDSWSLFIEEGGRDHYWVPSGFGQASDNSMSGFFDLSGVDEYVSASGGGRVGNAMRVVNEPGGLFVDR